MKALNEVCKIRVRKNVESIIVNIYECFLWTQFYSQINLVYYFYYTNGCETGVPKFYKDLNFGYIHTRFKVTFTISLGWKNSSII